MALTMPIRQRPIAWKMPVIYKTEHVSIKAVKQSWAMPEGELRWCHIRRRRQHPFWQGYHVEECFVESRFKAWVWLEWPVQSWKRQ